MKSNSDNRIDNAKNVTLEDLKSKIQSSDPSRYDQMLVEGEDRKIYYYAKYNALSYSRNVFQLKFPLFSNIKSDFEQNYLHAGSGDTPYKLDNDNAINSIISHGVSPENSARYSSQKLVFSDLPIEMNGNSVDSNQSTYIIPSETEMCECHGCRGEKYVTCPKKKCHGQHIYDCEDCRGRGEYTCPSCNGRGSLKCTSCRGSGIDKDSNDRRAKCKSCNGSGERKCSSLSGHGLGGALVKKAAGNEYCGGKGIIRCKTCETTGKIECKTCYGDHIDGRYGKVDCDTCDATGQLGTITYIETKIGSVSQDEMVCDGQSINADGFSFDKIKSHADDGTPVETYFNLNNTSRENYDNHSDFISKSLMANHNLHKDMYPSLISEEIYYNAVPCSTLHYQHILSGTNHDVSVIDVDRNSDILWHSDPTKVEVKKVEKNGIKDLIGKAFSSRRYKEKIDKRNEIIFMVHMAKADGVIEDSEKKILAKYISDLNDFTSVEKKELFDLMSSQNLPPIQNQQAVFSTPDRETEVLRKLKEIIGKADGELEDAEKSKLVELKNKIEEARSSKKGFFANFFGTWQVSVPLMLSIAAIGFLIYWMMFTLPRSNAESLHENLLKKESTIVKFIEQQNSGEDSSYEDLMNADFDDMIMGIYELKDKINALKHDSELTFESDGKEVSYKDFWEEKRLFYLEQTKDMKDDFGGEEEMSDGVIDEPTGENEDEEMVSYEGVIGTYSGDFGDDVISITISKVDDNGNAKGFNSVGQNAPRNLKGVISAREGYFECEFNEPGDDEWDGVFNFTIDVDGSLNGSWSANNGRLDRDFSIEKD